MATPLYQPPRRVHKSQLPKTKTYPTMHPLHLGQRLLNDDPSVITSASAAEFPI